MTDFLDHVAAALVASQSNDSTTDVQVPPAPVCDACGGLYGRWSTVHFVKPLDAKPCSGSWVGQRKAGPK